MRLRLEPDQEFFRETTARFLGELVPVGKLRQLRDDPDGHEADYWRRGAELGWTSLLVAEEHGGGSISGLGLVDLTLVAHEFGAHAAPGPLTSVNVVAAALSTAGSHPDVLAGLLAGTSLAAWAHGEPAPHDGLGAVGLTVRIDGDEVVLDGVKRPVESAARSEHLLVSGRTGDGRTLVLVPTSSPGVSVRPMRSVDLTRRFDAVTFDSVRLPSSAIVGRPGDAGATVDHLQDVATVVGCAESVGALQRAFDITLEWAFDRYSFGRPLASYQALKHRIADMKSWLEGSHAVADDAAEAVASGASNAALLVSAAAAFIGDRGSELMHECVQLHGGIGVTYEHDLHLFLRRQTLNRALYGTPADHKRRLADIVEAQEVTA